MRFAHDQDGQLLDATTSKVTEAYCFQCGHSLSLRGRGQWTSAHADSTCRLCAKAETTLEDDVETALEGRVTLIRYSPMMLGGEASIFFTTDKRPPKGWKWATWNRKRGLFRIKDGPNKGTLVSLRVITMSKGNESIPPVDLLPCDDEARRMAQQFHRIGILHVDPLSDMLPLWRAIKAPPGGGKTTLLLDLVAAWPMHQFLLVTYARDIAIELRERAMQRRPRVENIVIQTVDALCYAAEFDVDGRQYDRIFQLGDREVIQAAFPRCRPWTRKRNATDIGPLVEYYLSRPNATPLLCEAHQPFSWIITELSAPTMTKTGLSHLRRSFASMRSRAGRTTESIERLRKVPSVANADVLLVDEAQDLTPQALDILSCLDKPTVVTGDPRQTVYDYTDHRVCKACLELNQRADESSHDGGVVPSGFAGADEADTIELYETHRLDPTSCRVIEEWTRGALSMVSSRPPDELDRPPPIQCVQEVPPSPEPILLLVRTNKEIIDAIWRDPTLGVVGGSNIASDLQRHHHHRREEEEGGRIKARASAMESLASSLSSKGILKETCEMLEARDSPLCTASQGGRVISSVHRSKGAEAPHVVVDLELVLSNQGQEDCGVSVVASSRHTRLLSLLVSSR